MTPQLVFDEIADAILDGTPIDWSRVSASDALRDPALVEQLKTLQVLRLARTGHRPVPSGTWSWGHLRVFERIGQGAYGDVYRAWDTRLDREVALKLLPLDMPGAAPSRSTVIEEGRLLARVRHPNVVTIYGAERIDGRVGLWMEFVKGCTLEEALRGGRAFTASEATRLGVELCRAVTAVHAAGLLHRDIKAQNVMLDNSGRVVLMDFGTGRELNENNQRLDATDARIAGTPLYLAPEVLSGGAATAHSEVYSIGVLLFHVLTHAYPVSGKDLTDLRRAHAAREASNARVDRADIPQRLRRIIAAALDPDPGRRYASADAMAAALAASARVPAGRRVLYAVATAAAVVAAIAGGWNLGLRERMNPALIALGVTAATPAKTSPAKTPAIAVLPFRNTSADPRNDGFADGLTIDVIDHLANVDGLEVRSRTSSFAFKDRVRDLRDVEKQLNVDYVVEADVQRDGSRVRVSARFVRTSDDVPLWSEKFDLPLDDVFAIQDKMSREIVNRLRLTLGRGQRRYRTNVAAYDLYLQGRALVDRLGVGNAERAATLFGQVIAMDPTFAPAHAGLAEAFAAMSWTPDGLSPAEGLAGMRPAVQAALTIDPLLPEAHAAMGLLHARELNWDKSRESFELALAHGNNMSAIRSRYAMTTLLPLGETAKAEEQLAAALISDPLSLEVRRAIGYLQIIQGRYDEAVLTLQQVVDADSTFRAANPLARALTWAGRPAEAIALWERKLEPGNWELWLIPAYLKEKRHADFNRLVAEDRSKEPYRQARICAALGDKEGAFEALNRAIDAGLSHRVAATLPFPELELLRGDPRLDLIKKRLNLR